MKATTNSTDNWYFLSLLFFLISLRTHQRLLETASYIMSTAENPNPETHSFISRTIIPHKRTVRKQFERQNWTSTRTHESSLLKSSFKRTHSILFRDIFECKTEQSSRFKLRSTQMYLNILANLHNKDASEA